MSKTYYKVVQKNMTSACWWKIAGFRVEYKLNQWTKPKVEGTKLFIFDNLEAAKKFANVLWEDIYECKADSVSTPKKIAHPLSIAKFWKLKKNKKKIDDKLTIDIPESTKTASRVMLTKKLYSYENYKLVKVK